VIGLIRHEVIKALRAHGRVCAIELLASSPTAATWSLVAVECASLGTARGHYRRSTLVRVCELVALGLTDDAAHVLAAECGMSDIEWSDDTRREVAA
jgi:hypothetical protein